MTITQSELKEILHYNPYSGLFIWNISKGKCKKGFVAGTIRKPGYIQIGIKGYYYQAHRLVWLYIHGSFPDNHIDHIDHNGLNNRLNNLREATRSENMQNKIKAQQNNKSTGLLGAFKHTNRNSFIAQIRINGEQKYLGTFKTAQEAHEAYIKAKRKIHTFNTI